jgi:hypothetical protein
MSVNVDLLGRVRDFITDPKTAPYFSMETWFDLTKVGLVVPDYADSIGFRKTDEDSLPPCGTTLCVAGLAILFDAPVGSVIYNGRIRFPDGRDAACEDYGAEVLGLDANRASILFFAGETAARAVLDHLIAHPRCRADTLRRVAAEYE